MKKCLILVLTLALLLPLGAQASGLPQINVGGLPQLDVPVKPSGVLPDPAQLLKVKGETFAADYAYNGRLYTVYTYACVAEDAAALYRSQAQSAGYQAQTIQAEGFTAFEFTFEGKNALYFPSYSGVTMLMVENGLVFGEPLPEGNYISFVRNGRKITTGSNASITLEKETGFKGIGHTFVVPYSFQEEPVSYFALAFPDDAIEGSVYEVTHKNVLKCLSLYTAEDEYLVFHEDDYGDEMETSRDFFTLKITKMVKTESLVQVEGTFEGAFKDGSVTYENGSFRAEMHR